MYHWICEKCGTDQRSSTNVCSNTACRFVFQGSPECEVRCARCGREPAGSSDFRKGRSTTMPLMKLGMSELSHPDYEIYGEAGREYLERMALYVGQPLCQGCHPRGMGLKLELEASAEDLREAGRQSDDIDVYARLLESAQDLDKKSLLMKRAYREGIEALKKARDLNPDLTGKEEVAIVQKAIAPILRSEPFLYERMDLSIRQAVKKAIPSNIALRYLPKEELYRTLVSYKDLRTAVKDRDLGRILLILGEAKKSVREVLEKAVTPPRRKVGSWSSLLQTLWDLRERMLQVSNRMAVYDAKIREDVPRIEENERLREKSYERVEELERRFKAGDDRDVIKIDLHRARAELSRITDLAREALNPEEVRLWKRELEEGTLLYRKYEHLLESAERIFFWDIKEDLWDGGYFEAPRFIDYTTRGKRGIRVPTLAFMRRPLNEPQPVRCDVCERETYDIRILPKAFAVQVINPEKGFRVDRTEYIPHEKVKDLTFEEAKSLKTATFFICPDCERSPDFVDKVRAEREERKAGSFKREEEKKREGAREKQEELRHRRAVGEFEERLENAVFGALNVVRKLGALWAAPLVRLDPEKGDHTLAVVAVSPAFGKLPAEIRAEWPVRIVSVPGALWKTGYLWTWMTRKEKDRFISEARARDWKFSEDGLLYKPGYPPEEIADPERIARRLGLEVPPLPAVYWKGACFVDGISAVNPNLRDVVLEIDERDLEPLLVHAPKSDREIEREKEVKKYIRTSRNEELRLASTPWYLRTGRKGGTAAGKKKVKTPGLPPKSDYVPKDLSKSMMVAGPYRGDDYTRHTVTQAEEDKWWAERSEQSRRDMEEYKRLAEERSRKEKREKRRIIVRLPRK